MALGVRRVRYKCIRINSNIQRKRDKVENSRRLIIFFLVTRVFFFFRFIILVPLYTVYSPISVFGLRHTFAPALTSVRI